MTHEHFALFNAISSCQTYYKYLHLHSYPSHAHAYTCDSFSHFIYFFFVVVVAFHSLDFDSAQILRRTTEFGWQIKENLRNVTESSRKKVRILSEKGVEKQFSVRQTQRPKKRLLYWNTLRYGFGDSIWNCFRCWKWPRCCIAEKIKLKPLLLF